MLPLCLLPTIVYAISGMGTSWRFGPQVFPVPVLHSICVVGLGGRYRLFILFLFCVSFELYSFEFYSVCIVSISCVIMLCADVDRAIAVVHARM